MLDANVTTENVASCDRLDYWNDFIQDIFPGMTVSSAPNIRASWKSRTIGELRLGIVNSEKGLVQRWQTQDIDANADRTIIHLQSTGCSVTSQNCASVFTGPLDLGFCNGAIPYEINISDKNSMLVIDFPKSFLTIIPRYEVLRGARLKQVSRLHDFALSVLDEDLNALQTESDTDECLSEVFLTLIRACTDPTVTLCDDDLQDSHRIFQFIDNTIEDQTLHTRDIAAKLSISSKRVQRLFAAIGTTPSQFILKRRVMLAAQTMRARAFDGTITNLAMDAGFSDTAHLCRSFRKFFGMTPTEYTQMCRQRH